MTLQEQIDALAYPPTHQYLLDGLQPLETLGRRALLIDRVAPRFFDMVGGRFLDVGSNKGYFTLRGLAGGMTVTAIDPVEEYFQLCRKLAGDRARVVKTGIRDFFSTRRFDRIFLGNVHHYSFVEANHSYSYLIKLGTLCADGGLVLIEGPLGMECQDMLRVVTAGTDRRHFRRDLFLQACALAGFSVRALVPTVSDTPDRYLVLLRREPRTYFDRSDPYLNYTKEVLRREMGKALVVLEKDGYVTKLNPSHRPLGVAQQMAIEAAASSQYSNGMLGWVTCHDEVRGWRERLLGGFPLPFKHQRAQERAWTAYCEHNAYLTSMGYVDPDPGVVNWEYRLGRLLCFDKNSTVSCKAMSPVIVKRTQVAYSNLYRFPKPGDVEQVSSVLSTRDSRAIGAFFRSQR